MKGERETRTAQESSRLTEEVRGWFAGRLPDEWFTSPAEVIIDREEITVVGTLPAPDVDDDGESEAQDAAGKTAGDAAQDTAGERAGETAGKPAGQGEPTVADAAAEGRIRRFREETRSRRIEIAREAERRFGRKVAWGARCGRRSETFTTLSVPVMTRLRQPERRVLDTLVDAGVARSRSDALAWCVRLTGEHADAWLTELRSALRRVEEVRAQGPRLA